MVQQLGGIDMRNARTPIQYSWLSRALKTTAAGESRNVYVCRYVSEAVGKPSKQNLSDPAVTLF
jgi:hypothetical protein